MFVHSTSSAISFLLTVVAAALRKMKRHEDPGLSGLVAEMIQATGDIGTQWILDLCNGIMKEVCIPGLEAVWYYQFRRKRGSNGVWILQRDEIVGTCYESGGKDLRTQNSAAD